MTPKTINKISQSGFVIFTASFRVCLSRLSPSSAFSQQRKKKWQEIDTFVCLASPLSLPSRCPSLEMRRLLLSVRLGKNHCSRQVSGQKKKKKKKVKNHLKIRKFKTFTWTAPARKLSQNDVRRSILGGGV